MGRANVYGDTVAEGQKASALYLPSTSGNYVSAPSTAGLNVSGDLDIRIKAAPDKWYDSTRTQQWAGKLLTSGQYSWDFTSNSSLAMRLRVSDTGTDIVNFTLGVPSLTDGETGWIRVTLDADNGAGGKTAKYYESTDDGVTWVERKSVTSAGTITPHAGTDPIQVGGHSDQTYPTIGLIHAFELRDGIDGPIVAQWDGRIPATRQRDPQGNIWTVNGTANGWVIP